MINEQNIATAQLAQLFGSELLKVQTNSQTDSGYAPNIVNINPKSFLIPTQQQGPARRQQSIEEQRILEAIQREAESTHPLPPPIEQLSRQNEPPIPEQTTSAQIAHISSNDSNLIESFDRVCSLLERMCIALETK